MKNKMESLDIKNSIAEVQSAIPELVKIIQENYIDSPQFREEFLAALDRKTGNSNLSKLCDTIISYTQHEKNSGGSENEVFHEDKRSC